MSDPTVAELIAEATRLTAEVTSLTRENRAFRWLAEFGDDKELSAIAIDAEAKGSLDDVLMFLDWALERELLFLPDELLESGFERHIRSEWARPF